MFKKHLISLAVAVLLLGNIALAETANHTPTDAEINAYIKNISEVSKEAEENLAEFNQFTKTDEYKTLGQEEKEMLNTMRDIFQSQQEMNFQKMQSASEKKCNDGVTKICVNLAFMYLPPLLFNPSVALESLICPV